VTCSKNRDGRGSSNLLTKLKTMATSVNNAFDIFLKDTVRIAKDRSDVAKTSKNNLVNQIEKFPDDGKFLTLHPDISIDYGSFSRKTKIRPLDDIDIMIVLHAEGNWRDWHGDHYKISVQQLANKQLDLCNEGTNILNSIKVINKFKEYLSNVPDYKKADIKRNQEAATLDLNSYEWTFDIVPCFITSPDAAGNTFYLIPDGKGNWKPTDPRIDKQRTQDINAAQTVSVLDMIRLIKYWTKRATMPTMKSYYLENMILDYYGYADKSKQWLDRELPNLFAYIYHNVEHALQDPKGYQGDINHLTADERAKVKEKARVDYNKANEAIEFEKANKIKESIEKWREIFGDEFPNYG